MNGATIFSMIEFSKSYPGWGEAAPQKVEKITSVIHYFEGLDYTRNLY